MIRIGPAGIPLSCKGRTLKDGIIYTKSLELDALEVQFVRGIRMSEEDAAEVGEVAEAAEVELHVHAPYYTNLAGDERNLQLSRDKILKAANLAHIMGAETVAVHPGFYGELTPEEALERIVQVAGDLRDDFKSNGWKPKLALETMGKRSVFGSIEEIIEVCRQVDDVVPVVDFAHIHARGNGSLNTVEDFQEVFDKLIPLGQNHYLVHFTGVLYENGNERHHLPIKKGDLRFEPLVEVILENDYNVTLISTSPILEHDAMYMQIVLDRVKEKREQRLQKEAVKLQQDAEKAILEEEKAREEAEKAAEEEAKRREAEAAAAAEAARKAAEEKEKAEAEPRPQCAALTHAGTPCKNPSRGNSKYCSSHRGWRPSKEQREILDAMEAKAKGGKKPAKKAAKAPKTSTNAAVAKSGKKVAKKTATTKQEPSKRSRKEVTKKPAKKSAAKKTAAKKTATKKTAAKKTAAKKTTPKKAVKKAAAKKTTAKKAAKKSVPKKSAAKKPAATKKTAAKKAPATKGPTAKPSETKAPTAKPDAPSPAASAPAEPTTTGRLKAVANRLLRKKK